MLWYPKLTLVHFCEMIDTSWGELFVLGSVGAALAGRRDLPTASRYVGLQVGRVVGLLQGARARADRFSAQNELRQLQNELRSGLRELDQVKTELIVAASMERTLGTTTPLANRRRPEKVVGDTPTVTANIGRSIPKFNTDNVRAREVKLSLTAGVESLPLSPAIQSERASMEEEWEKRGISFRSIAEQGYWMQDSTVSLQTSTTGEGTTGSESLEKIIQQNLLFDQYDRVVKSQEYELEQRVADMETKGRNKGGEYPGSSP